MLPKFLQPVLWSYDFARIDGEKNKKIIIQQILHFGTHVMTQWMFEHYPLSEIKAVFKSVRKNSWDKKSYNFWRIILNP